ncbi:MAG: hypothetical protein AAF196_01800 [Planctomycetota bacterium]
MKDLPLRALAILALVLSIPSCASLEAPVRFEPLGAYQAQVTTDDAEARFWFDQGLLWTYGFNHLEAVRSFREAQRIDPDFAMAYWGEALALGPNLNGGILSPENAVRAHEASQTAIELSATTNPVERALIEALTVRYAGPEELEFEDEEQRKALDARYAEAMAAVMEQFPEDPDVCTLFADARMNQRPWDYWTEDGEPKSGIAEAMATLRRVTMERPDHPGGHHLMIYITEASSDPSEGVASADALRTLVPGSGHLVHMPSHTYQRVGRYYDAERTNRNAIAVDRAYFREAGTQPVYEFYRAHNHHFQAWAAMFGGRYEAAVEASRNLIEDLPAWVKSSPGVGDFFFSVELHVFVRFGRWDEVLAHPDFGEGYPVARSIRLYSRALAYGATGQVDAARAEQQRFLDLLAAIPEESKIGINTAEDVFAIAQSMLEGEILYREGEFDAAFSALQVAAELEDGLTYDEPRGWMTPVRHALGALALEQGRLELAVLAYREDLERNVENGWALHGLAECLTKLGQTEEAEDVSQRFALAWQHADTDLSNGSCFCRQAIGAAATGSCCDDAESVAAR